MRNVCTFSFLLLMTSVQFANAQSLSTFINEINYMASNPTEAGLEIAGEAGSDLAGWSLVGYALDGTIEYIDYISAGVIPNQQNGHGTFWYDVEQNSNGGGIALVNSGGNVVQFLSYGTVNFANVIIDAIEGPASGTTSQYVGTQLLPQSSLQLVGTGLTYANFLWSLPSVATQGVVNTNQIFGLPPLLNVAPNSEAPIGSTSLQSIDNQLFKNSDKEIFDFVIFPNPTADRVQIQLNSTSTTPVIVRVFDSMGRMVNGVKWQGNAVQVDMAHLLPGSYTFHLASNGQVFTKTVIRQ